MKKQAIIVGLLIIIVLSFSMTISGMVNLGQNRLAKSGDTIAYQEFTGAKAGNISVVPVSAQLVSPTNITALPATTIPTNAPATPVQTAPTPTIFLAGGDNAQWAFNNNVISSQDGISWNQITTNAIWNRRSYHTLTSFNNRMWLMNGVFIGGAGYVEYNDIYNSTDGISWTRVTANAPWSIRYSHTTEVLNGRMFMMGGASFLPPTGPRTYFNEVWSSIDGINWSLLGNAPWIARKDHASVVFNNKLWVIGGGTPGPNGWIDEIYLNDVWSSRDGITWTQTTANAPWSPRGQLSAVVFNGRIYVMGGANTGGTWGTWLNDVWSSADGITWTQVTPAAQWSPRMDQISLVFNGLMWVIAGSNLDPFVNTVYSDAWSSPDGINWTQQTTSIPNLLGDGSKGVVFP